MTEATKALVLQALTNIRGDDNYQRARSAFRRLTLAQMRQPYGESGQTCQEVLDGYRDHVEKVDRAIAEVAAL